MPSSPQDGTGGDGDADSAALLHAQEDNSAPGSASTSARKAGKKHRRTSSGSVQGNPPNARGPTAARVVRKAKGLRPQKAGSWDANAFSQEKSQNSSDEIRDWEAESRMFTNASAQQFADNMR